MQRGAEIANVLRSAPLALGLRRPIAAPRRVSIARADIRRFALARLVRAAIVAAGVALLAFGRPAAPTAGLDFSHYQIDYSGEELMRLTNLDRVALGLPKLASDPFLITLARDGAFRCPSTGATVSGRSRSMALSGFFSHSISGCQKSDGSYYTILDVLYPEFGYNTYRAENIAMNSYGVAPTTFVAGCDASGGNCRGGTATTPETIAVAERGFMKSPEHRENILGDYDRFGCGSWMSTAANMKYYTCLFSRGGPKPLDGTKPVFTSVSGSGVRVSQGASVTFSAAFSDNVRLAHGYVKLDSRVVSNWAYWYDKAADVRSISVATAALTKGTHTLMWAATDVSTWVTYRSVTFYVV